jgi:hypothetical protein
VRKYINSSFPITTTKYIPLYHDFVNSKGNKLCAVIGGTQAPTTHSVSVNRVSHPQLKLDDRENHLEAALCLASFLLDWRELEIITIGMPDDLSVTGQDTSDYDYWSWVLHEPLLRAFTQGWWREVCLAHPKTYADPNLFLYHNISYYVEE